jgi:hypothetical protein
MEQSDLLRYVVERFERLGIRYFVTGSVVTVFYGEPRFTHDVDIVATLNPAEVARFCREFPSPDFYVNEEAACQAAAACGQFNIIHPASGLKIDVIIPADTAFNRSRFARATRVSPAPDYQASFASPEDMIIKKMESYREGGSEKHLRDITGVLKVSGHQIDRAYIAQWANPLGLTSIWQAILQRLGTL